MGIAFLKSKTSSMKMAVDSQSVIAKRGIDNFEPIKADFLEEMRHNEILVTKNV